MDFPIECFIRNKDSDNVAILYTTTPRTFQRTNVVSSVSRWATCGKFFEYLEALKSSKRSWTQFTLTQFIPRFLKTTPKLVILHRHRSRCLRCLMAVNQGWSWDRNPCSVISHMQPRFQAVVRVHWSKFGVYCLLYTISHWNRKWEQKYIYL